MPPKKYSKASKPRRPFSLPATRRSQHVHNGLLPSSSPKDVDVDVDDIALIPTGMDYSDEQGIAPIALHPKTPEKGLLLATSPVTSLRRNELLISDSGSPTEQQPSLTCEKDEDRKPTRNPSPMFVVNPHARHVESVHTDASPFLPSQTTQDLRLIVSDNSPRRIRDLTQEEREKATLDNLFQVTEQLFHESDSVSLIQDTPKDRVFSPDPSDIYDATPLKKSAPSSLAHAAIDDIETNTREDEENILPELKPQKVEKYKGLPARQTTANSKRRRIQPSSPKQPRVSHQRPKIESSRLHKKRIQPHGSTADDSASEWQPSAKARESSTRKQASRTKQQRTAPAQPKHTKVRLPTQTANAKDVEESPKGQLKAKKAKQIAKRPINLDGGDKTVPTVEALVERAWTKSRSSQKRTQVAPAMSSKRVSERPSPSCVETSVVSEQAWIGKGSLRSSIDPTTDVAAKPSSEKRNRLSKITLTPSSKEPMACDLLSDQLNEADLHALTLKPLPSPFSGELSATSPGLRAYESHSDDDKYPDRQMTCRVSDSQNFSSPSQRIRDQIENKERITGPENGMPRYANLKPAIQTRGNATPQVVAIQSRQTQQPEPTRPPTRESATKAGLKEAIIVSSDSESDFTDGQDDTYPANASQTIQETPATITSMSNPHVKTPAVVSEQLWHNGGKPAGLSSDPKARKPHLIAFGINGPVNQGRSTPKSMASRPGQGFIEEHSQSSARKRKSTIQVPKISDQKRLKRVIVSDRAEVLSTPGSQFQDSNANRPALHGVPQSPAENTATYRTHYKAAADVDEYVPDSPTCIGSQNQAPHPNFNGRQVDSQPITISANSQPTIFEDCTKSAKISMKEYGTVSELLKNIPQSHPSSSLSHTWLVPPRRRSIVNEKGSPIAETSEYQIPQFGKLDPCLLDHLGDNGSRTKPSSRHRIGKLKYQPDAHFIDSVKPERSLKGSFYGYEHLPQEPASRPSMENDLHTLKSGFSGTTLDGTRSQTGTFTRLHDQFVWASRESRPARFNLHGGRNTSRLYERQNPPIAGSSRATRVPPVQQQQQQQRLGHASKPSDLFGNRIIDSLTNNHKYGMGDQFPVSGQQSRHHGEIGSEDRGDSNTGSSQRQSHGELGQTIHSIVEMLLTHLKLKESMIDDVAEHYDKGGRQMLGNLEGRHSRERGEIIRQYEEQRSNYIWGCQASSDEIGNLQRELSSVNIIHILERRDDAAGERLAAATKLQGSLKLAMAVGSAGRC